MLNLFGVTTQPLELPPESDTLEANGARTAPPISVRSTGLVSMTFQTMVSLKFF